MLILEVVLFVFWVALGAFVYGTMSWQKRKIVRRAKTAGIEFSKEERKNLEQIREMKSKALFGCGMMAAAMLCLVLNHLI